MGAVVAACSKEPSLSDDSFWGVWSSPPPRIRSVSDRTVCVVVVAVVAVVGAAAGFRSMTRRFFATVRVVNIVGSDASGWPLTAVGDGSVTK